MIRDAKLYFLSEKDWQPLVELVAERPFVVKSDDLAIFDVVGEGKHRHYAIISVSNDLDTIIEEYGGIPSSERDLLIPVLKGGSRDTVFGDKSLAAFLKW